jgi:DNA-binding FrmR family transcriptional regulator
MVDDGDECPAVLRQILAVQGALEKVSQILMAEHLSDCIPNELQGDDRKGLERALDEVSDLLLESRHA